MDVTRDVAALRQKLSGAPSTMIRVQCLSKPEAERILQALTPAERQRVTFSWLMQKNSRIAQPLTQLRAYAHN